MGSDGVQIIMLGGDVGCVDIGDEYFQNTGDVSNPKAVHLTEFGK